MGCGRHCRCHGLANGDAGQLASCFVPIKLSPLLEISWPFVIEYSTQVATTAALVAR